MPLLTGSSMSGRLQDKVCVVTGGTSGIGRDTVQRFIEEGAKVVFCGRGEDAGNEIAAAMGENCVFIKCDVMVEEEIEAVIEKAVELWGKLDVLFNNVCTTNCHHSLDSTTRFTHSHDYDPSATNECRRPAEVEDSRL